jgi:lipoprotein-releasing system permease protein
MRYLQTRYLAFVCIVSVMLGVATLIVVNAVMSGFSTKLKDRLHGILSDVVIDTERTDGFEVLDENGYPLTPEQIIAKIKSNEILRDRVQAVTPTIETFAILQFRYRGTVIAKPVRLIGIDPQSRADVGGFAEYLVRQKGSATPSFELTAEAIQRHEWNRKQFEFHNATLLQPVKTIIDDPNSVPPPNMEIDKGIPEPKLYGVIVGYAIAHFRYRDDKGQTVEEVALEEGDDVIITTAGGQELKPVWGSFLVTDYLKTEMSEYDQSFVFVPLDQLQRIRGMIGRATAFQIKLTDYERDKDIVTKELRVLFRNAPEVRIATWEEHQGPLLAAIDVERGILNLLLFMIVGVAGFSILAIFTMIVSEKYRDIGIMKSLGASNWGVLEIFIGYGLLLGTVGCILGTLMGVCITNNINEIEAVLSSLTGRAVFPRDVYYFKEIPTNIDALTIVLIDIGAVTTAMLFSLIPAWRAASLHPVRALRFE